MSEEYNIPREEHQEGANVSQEINDFSREQVKHIVQEAQKNFDKAVSLTEQTIQASIDQMNTLLTEAKVQITNKPKPSNPNQPSGPLYQNTANPLNQNFSSRNTSSPHADYAGDNTHDLEDNSSPDAVESAVYGTSANMETILEENEMNIQAAQQAAQDAIMHSILQKAPAQPPLDGEVLPPQAQGMGNIPNAGVNPANDNSQLKNMFNYQKPH